MSEVAVEKSATQSKCEANQNSSNEDWKDFTNQFREYCGFLPLGELVHDESFTLREAMSAVELLDSKMDETIAIRDFYLKHCTCGTDTLSSHSTLDPKLLESKLSLNDQGSSKSKCHCLSSRRPIDVDLAFELGAVLTNGFTDSERIAVMDELLACVFAWLDGQGTIAHTLFASYYLNRPHILRRDKEPLLRAFVEFVLKLADHSRGIICSASVYEEEDFQSAIFNFSTTVRLDDGTEAELSNARFSSILKELDEDLSRRVKALSRKLKPSADQQTSKPNGLVAGAESPLSDSDATRSHSKSTSSSDSSSPRAELDLLNALHCRLKFARYLFLFFHHFRSACLIPSESHSRELEEARRHLRAAIAALREVDASVSLGVQHDRPEGVYTDPELLKLGFDSFLHHHISSGGIPRFARIPTRKAALKWFAECLDSLLAAFDVRRSETFEQLLNFLDWHRMKQRNSALTRSALFLLVYPHQEGGSGSGVEKKLKLFGERSAAETAHESVRRFLLFAPWSCSDPRMQALFDVERGRLPMRAHLDVFLQRVALVLHESVVTRCVNPSRQRERTPFLLENELSVFYSETAEVLDDTFTHAVLALDATHPLRVALNPIFERTKEQSGQLQRLHCFDLYPLHHIVVEMVDYTLDGLRSQLFASYEFRYVFWYLGMPMPCKPLMPTAAEMLISTYSCCCVHREYVCVHVCSVHTGEMLYGWLNHLHQLRSEQLEMVTRLEQEWEKSNRSSKSKAKGRTRREKRRDDAAQPFRSERDEFDYSALVVNAYRHLALGIFKLILGFELLNWCALLICRYDGAIAICKINGLCRHKAIIFGVQMQIAFSCTCTSTLIRMFVVQYYIRKVLDSFFTVHNLLSELL